MAGITIAINLRNYQNSMLETIANYRLIADNLHTSAQPTVDEIEKLKEAGIDIVINLARPDSPNAISNEAQLVENNGMRYIPIPVDFENPTLTDLKKFFATMNENTNQCKLVHCARNWRVSCFVYLYRVIQQGCDNRTAKEDMLSVWQPDKIWQSFIDESLSNSGSMK